MPAQEYLRRVLTARVYDVAIESPLELAPGLSERLGNPRLAESARTCSRSRASSCAARTTGWHSFRATNSSGACIAGIGGQPRARRVALAAQKLGCRALIVMPVTTPEVKVDAVRTRDAEVVLFGDSYSDAYTHALKLQRKYKLTFVHPFDDPDVIAGQGTIAMEILRQHHPVDHGPIHAVFVAIGGGGLIAGVAAYIKALAPQIKVIGVQTTRFRCDGALARSRTQGQAA
jgi:threonine dehydratase